MKKFIILSFLVLAIAACGGSDDQKNAGTTDDESVTESTTSANPDYDPDRGEGKFKEVKIDPKVNDEMASKGEKIVDLKCGSCHKMTDEKLVGPGWKGVTSRHKPEWIMNFMTNTDAMIDKDPKAQAMLEICMVRMPNQNLSDDDARSIYEYMRKNDEVK